MCAGGVPMSRGNPILFFNLPRQARRLHLNATAAIWQPPVSKFAPIISPSGPSLPLSGPGPRFFCGRAIAPAGSAALTPGGAFFCGKKKENSFQIRHARLNCLSVGLKLKLNDRLTLS